MCGIVGLFTYKTDDSVDPLVKSLIQRHLFTETLHNSEPRGKDSTGMSFLWDDKVTTVLKQPIPVSNFVIEDGLMGEDYNNPEDDKAHFNHAMKEWTRKLPETKLLQALGHVRKKTQGSEYNPYNNHPIIIKGDSKVPKGGSIGNGNDLVIGVHNGGISNDDALFSKYKFDRIGEVDSEIIFHLLYQYKDDFTVENLLKVSEELKGAFAVMAFNPIIPNKVACLRETRPLEAVFIKEIGTLILVSEKKFVTPVLDEYERWRIREGNNTYKHTTEEGEQLEVNIAEKFPSISGDWKTVIPQGVFVLDLDTEVDNSTKVNDLVKVFQAAKPATKTDTKTSSSTKPTTPKTPKQTDPTEVIDISEYEEVIEADAVVDGEVEEEEFSVIDDGCPYNWEERKSWGSDAFIKADADGDTRLLITRLAETDCMELLSKYLIEVPDEESAATMIANFYDLIFPEGFAYGVKYGYTLFSDEMDAVNQEEDDAEENNSTLIETMRTRLSVKDAIIENVIKENKALEDKLAKTERKYAVIEKHLSNLSPIINTHLKNEGVMNDKNEIDKNKMSELRQKIEKKAE